MHDWTIGLIDNILKGDGDDFKMGSQPVDVLRRQRVQEPIPSQFLREFWH